MTIFTKAKIENILKDKVSSGEIRGYEINGQFLRIYKSKRTGFTFRFNLVSQHNLIYILKKKTPKPEVQTISDFYQLQINKLNETR